MALSCGEKPMPPAPPPARLEVGADRVRLPSEQRAQRPASETSSPPPRATRSDAEPAPADCALPPDWRRRCSVGLAGRNQAWRLECQSWRRIQLGARRVGIGHAEPRQDDAFQPSIASASSSSRDRSRAVQKAMHRQMGQMMPQRLALRLRASRAASRRRSRCRRAAAPRCACRHGKRQHVGRLVVAPPVAVESRGLPSSVSTIASSPAVVDTTAAASATARRTMSSALRFGPPQRRVDDNVHRQRRGEPCASISHGSSRRGRCAQYRVANGLGSFRALRRSAEASAARS